MIFDGADDKAEALAGVREILDRLISQLSTNDKEMDKSRKEETNIEKNSYNEGQGFFEGSRTEENKLPFDKEKVSENQPVIRLAKFAVDPSSQRQNDDDAHLTPAKSTSMKKCSADSNIVSTDSPGWTVTDNPAELFHAEDDNESKSALDSFEYAGLSNEIDLKTDILDDVDDKHVMTIDLSEENQPSTSRGFSQETDEGIETIDILDDDEIPSDKSKAYLVCFKYVEHEKFSIYNLQQRNPTSNPEEYLILTSSVESEEMIATKLFISKHNYDQVESLNVGDWVWLMAHFTFFPDEGKILHHVKIELEGVLPLNAYIPKDIDQVEKCIQLKQNFVLSKKRLTHIFNCHQNISDRFCNRFNRHGQTYFVNCSEALGLDWISLMFEYNETLVRRDKYVKKYPHLKQPVIADTERLCKSIVLRDYSYDSTDLSEATAKVVDNMVFKLEEMIKAKLDSRISNIASGITARIYERNKGTELQKQTRHYAEVTKRKVKVIHPKGPKFFICPQAHKHKCSQRFTFTSHDDVIAMLEHLDIPSEVMNLQYKLLKGQFRKNQKNSSFNETFYRGNRALVSSLFYICCYANTHGDIVTEEMLAAIKENVNHDMKEILNQYIQLHANIPPTSSNNPASSEGITSSTSSVFFPCPQQSKHHCSKKFAISRFIDVVTLSDHITIPSKVMGYQLHNLMIMAKENGRTGNICPISFCNQTVEKEVLVNHFICKHQVESMMLYLFWDAKDYGDGFNVNLLRSIEQVAPAGTYKSLMKDYLKFMHSTGNTLKEGITVPKVQVMISDEVRFDIEVLDTNPEVSKSIPSSQNFLTLTSEGSGTTQKNTSLSDVSKKKKRIPCSQTRGFVTDAEVDTIAQNYKWQFYKQKPRLKRTKTGRSSEAKTKKLLEKEFENKRQEVQNIKSRKQEKRRIGGLKKNNSTALEENDHSQDKNDPLKVISEDEALDLSRDTSETAEYKKKITETDIFHVANEPVLVSTQSFASFDEMLGITEDRTLKRKHEVENKSDPWKRLKSSGTQSMASESSESFHRYLFSD